MSARLREHATYEDLLRVPENMVAELIEGELYASPRPSGTHSRFASALGFDIGTPYDRGRGGPGGWWILFEPELHIGKNVLVPDLGGWRRERMPEIPRSHLFDIPPDWICEVVSPSSGRLDRVKKMPIYARAEVAYAWIVDPEQQTFEAYRRQDDGWYLFATHGGDDAVQVEPFAAVTLDLASIWGPPPS